jgi:hypothetical protein
VSAPRTTFTVQHLARPEDHGTHVGYGKGCRCDDCYLAQSQHAKDRRAGLVPPRKVGRTHGIRTTYAHGCRCDECTFAERLYKRDYRSRRAS